MAKISNFINAAAEVLGESLLWSMRDQAFYWVDIRARIVRRYDWSSGAVTAWDVPEAVGSMAVCQSGKLLVALETCVAFLDPKTGALDRVPSPETRSGMRFNDGRCDRQGRFWVGTTLNPTDAVGSLYRFTPDRQFTKFDTDIVIPNGIGWSPDDRTMYFSDSIPGKIYTYDFDAAKGTIANRRDFAECEWAPDGAAVDSEGFYWSAAYNGWRVTRYTPDGRVDRTIELPVQLPTCCAFGGPDLGTLYVTTGRRRFTEAQAAEQPWAGSILAIDVGVKGLPEPLFAA